MKTIHLLGSEEQNKFYLPKLNKLELYGAFCLTETIYCSNAYGIETSAEEDSNVNIVINGAKRWIGQGTYTDIFNVWVKNKNSNEIEGNLVEKTRIGLSTKKIEGKLGFRSIQN